jgi:serine/threonine-protein kinase
MAEVFRAREPRPAGEPRVVVVKRMLPDIAAQPGSRAMFEAESRLGSLIKHEAVVDVLGFGEEHGQPYLVLEYVRGLDLFRLNRFLTREGRTLGVSLTIYLVRRLLDGLHAVHEATDENGVPLSVVHRDVSPSNVLLSIHGDVKLGDFGIAYTELRESLPEALGAHAKGKLGYLAPEQVTGLDCDRRTDVFSAAVITAELLMGRPLFAGGSELAILLAIRDAKVHPFLEMAKSLPDGLGDVLGAALRRDPEDRVATALALSLSLAPYQDAPEEVLRRELAAIVMSAMQDVEPTGEIEATPLLPEDQLDARQPGGLPRGVSKAIHEPSAAGGPAERTTLLPAAGLAPTGKLTEEEYRIETTGGMRFGPWTYAQVVEALALGKIGPEDRVRHPDGGATRIQDTAAFRRHLAPFNMTPTTREQEQPPGPSEMLPLGHGGIITALTWAAVRRETGLWLCELGGVQKEVYLKKGTPEFVTSNLAGELLGEYLVATSVITRGELDMALAVLPRFEGRLGDTLAALGLVEPIHLFRHIAAQVRDKLLDLFLWTSGHATFYEGVEPPPSAFPLDLQPWKILAEGVDQRLSAGLEDERFEGRDQAVVAAARPMPSGLDPGALPHDLRTVLRALDTPMTLAQLRYSYPELRGGSGGMVKRSLVLLFHLRAVVWA